MKKAIILILAMLMFVLITVPASAAGVPTLEVETVTFTKGEDQVKVQIAVKNNPGITSIRVLTTYDNSALTLSSIEFGKDIKNDCTQPQRLESPVFLLWCNAIEDINDDFVLATLTFKVSESAKAGTTYPIEITYDPDEIYNVYFDNVEFAVENGGIAIEAAKCTHPNKEEISEVPATCKATGTKAHSKCKDCGKLFLNGEEVSEADLAIAINPDNHTGKTEIRNAKPATEDAEGYTGDTYCVDCGKKIKDGTSIPKSDHVHSMSHKTAVSATCTKDGVVEHYHCSKCGNDYADEAGANQLTTTAAPALGHKTEVKNAKAATCTEAGYTGDEICTVCGETVKKGEAIAANGHTEEIIEGKAATCTDTGLTQGKKCSVCQTVLEAQKETEALGHNYEKTVVPPTCTEPGYTSNTCSRCQDSFTSDETSAKGHTEIEVAEVPATCTKEGQTAGKKCSECDTIISGCETIPALGHVLEIRNQVEVTENTNGYTGDTYCTVCGKLITTGTIIYAHPRYEVVGYIILDDVYHVVHFTNNTACTARHVYGTDGRCECGALKKIEAVDVPGDAETIEVNDPIESNTTDEEPENTSVPESPADTDANPKTGIALSLIPAAVAAFIALKMKK